MTAPDSGADGGRATSPGAPAATPSDARTDPPTETSHRETEGTAERRQFGLALMISGWLGALIENAAAPHAGICLVRSTPTLNASNWPTIEVTVREGTFLVTVELSSESRPYHEPPTRFEAREYRSSDGGGSGA